MSRPDSGRYARNLPSFHAVTILIPSGEKATKHKNYKMTHSNDSYYVPALHVIFGTSILLNSLPLSVCQILTSPLPPVAKSALVLRGKTMSFTALPWHVLRRSGEISAKLSTKYFVRIFMVSEFLTNVYSVDVVFTCSTIYLMSVTAD